MSEFKSQYDRQKHCAENAHYYELLQYLQQLITAPFHNGRELYFLMKFCNYYNLQKIIEIEPFEGIMGKASANKWK